MHTVTTSTNGCDAYCAFRCAAQHNAGRGRDLCAWHDARGAYFARAFRGVNCAALLHGDDRVYGHHKAACRRARRLANTGRRGDACRHDAGGGWRDAHGDRNSHHDDTYGANSYGIYAGGRAARSSSVFYTACSSAYGLCDSGRCDSGPCGSGCNACHGKHALQQSHRICVCDGRHAPRRWRPAPSRKPLRVVLS